MSLSPDFPEPEIEPLAGLSLSFEAAVACKLSAVAVKYMPDGHVPKAQKGLSI